MRDRSQFPETLRAPQTTTCSSLTTNGPDFNGRETDPKRSRAGRRLSKAGRGRDRFYSEGWKRSEISRASDGVPGIRDGCGFGVGESLVDKLDRTLGMDAGLGIDGFAADGALKAI